MFSVLINAYACSPLMGSEPGMAWNWCVNLARHCELFIVTEGEFRDKIEAAVPTLQQGKNMHFYYNPVSDEVRRMCWNQGDWRFYRHYREWQRRTADMAREICRRERIDVLHQLNMIGFREPGYLWQVSRETGIPFVWGPVDAKAAFPMAYASGAPLRTRAFLHLKNAITKWQLRHSRRVREAARTASILLSASSNSADSFRRYLSTGSVLMNETGCAARHAGRESVADRRTFDILWVGKTDFRKQLGLAVRCVAMAHHHDLRFHIVGGGDTASYLEEAERLGIADICVVHGSVGHEEVQDIMRKSDLLLFTSVAEGTPHVVLESLANRLPVLCFDTCGQGDCITSEVGVKIPLSTPGQSVRDFAEQIERLYSHREELERMSENCGRRAEELSWERKAERMVELYGQAIKKKKSDAETF